MFIKNDINEKPDKNLTGKTFGILTVDKYMGKSPYGNDKWRCKCKCGNYIIERADLLEQNKRMRCSNKCSIPQNDLTGETFDYLTVEKYCGHGIWNCRCTCGRTKEATGSALRSGLVKSCGHIVSYGEAKIEDLLKEKNIKFKKQYSFADLLGPKNGRLKFDFGLLTHDNELSCLIEYQGIQHFKPNKKDTYFGKTEREITDKTKKEYCKNNNIPLYEIRYDQNVENELNKILYMQGG